MKKLTKEQTKIIYISAVVLIFLFCFWLFIYRPQTSKLSAIKKQITQAEAEIAEINRIIGNRELTEVVKELSTELNNAAAKFPSGEEDIIDALSQKARNLKIEVKDIIPTGRRALEERILSYHIEELSVSMNIVCEYKVLGEYLNILRNSFPFLVRVRQLNIKGLGEDQVNLDIALQILAYLSKRN